jgi:hypothetical protein
MRRPAGAPSEVRRETAEWPGSQGGRRSTEAQSCLQSATEGRVCVFPGEVVGMSRSAERAQEWPYIRAHAAPDADATAEKISEQGCGWGMSTATVLYSGRSGEGE